MKAIRKTETHLDANLDTDVAWARRKETINGALKMFRQVLDAVQRHAEWVEASHDISAVHLWALWELVQAPGMRVVDLSRAMAIPRPSAESLLAGLMERGLVRRQENQVTAGPEHFFATADGQHLAESSPQHAQNVLKAAMAHLPEATLSEMTHALSALVEHLPMRKESAARQPLTEILRPEGVWPIPAKTGTRPR